MYSDSVIVAAERGPELVLKLQREDSLAGSFLERSASERVESLLVLKSSDRLNPPDPYGGARLSCVRVNRDFRAVEHNHGNV
ncbi:hypothetical protein YT1_2239 [Rhodococcus ruber]|nr:hypothetical protein YT1_2239 [Rhodococcus ruber]